MSFPAPYFRTPSAYVPSSMWATKFHTPTKQKARLRFCLYYSLHFWIANWKSKDPRTEWQQASPDFNLLLISSWTEFWFVNDVHKYLNCSTLSKELLSVFISWLRAAFWSRNMTNYLVLSAFSSSPISLLATTQAPVFSFTACSTLLPNILTSST
jgi:hypothetical protein